MYYYSLPICYNVSYNITLWWRHQMETFSALVALCAGNSPVIGEFPAQRPVTRSFESGDLRHHRAHYTATVMWYSTTTSWTTGIILCMRPGNERRRYIVTPSLIGWAHTQNDHPDELAKNTNCYWHWTPVLDCRATNLPGRNTCYQYWCTLTTEWRHFEN